MQSNLYEIFLFSKKKNHILIYQFCHFNISGFFKGKFTYSAIFVVTTVGFLTILKVLQKGITI